MRTRIAGIAFAFVGIAALTGACSQDPESLRRELTLEHFNNSLSWQQEAFDGLRADAKDTRMHEVKELLIERYINAIERVEESLEPPRELILCIIQQGSDMPVVLFEWLEENKSVTGIEFELQGGGALVFHDALPSRWDPVPEQVIQTWLHGYGLAIAFGELPDRQEPYTEYIVIESKSVAKAVTRARLIFDNDQTSNWVKVANLLD